MANLVWSTFYAGTYDFFWGFLNDPRKTEQKFSELATNFQFSLTLFAGNWLVVCLTMVAWIGRNKHI